MSTNDSWSPVTPVTPAVKNFCIEVKASVEDKLGLSFTEYNPATFSKEESGTYYLVKVSVGEDRCFHAMLFEDSSGKVIVTKKPLYPKHFEDPLILY